MGAENGHGIGRDLEQVFDEDGAFGLQAFHDVLVMDDPTNHLDLESITALNEGLIRFSGSMLFSSHDHQFISSIANRIIEITPGGIMDRMMEFDEYLENDDIQSQVEKMYNV